MIYDQIERNYLFDLNASLVIDGFSRANIARFINHPEEGLETPNCYPRGEPSDFAAVEALLRLPH